MASAAAVGQAIVHSSHENETEYPPSPEPQLSIPHRFRTLAPVDQTIGVSHQRFPTSQNRENESEYPPSLESQSSMPPRLCCRTPSGPRSSLPSNSISPKSSDTEPAPFSTSTRITSVTSVPPPVARCDPPPDELQKNIQKNQQAHHVQYALARVRSRPHILEREHKAKVKETQKQDREDMLNEMFQIHRDTKGYTSDIRSFESFLGYQEHLEGRGLTPSRSMTNLRDRESTPSRAHRHSYPSQHIADHEVVSTEFLQRALEKAKRTLTSPPPPLPFSSVLDKLREDARKKDEAIEQRLRPPKALPSELENEVRALLNKRGVISKIAREQVNDKDISRLRPAQWLNDEIINFYGAMILARSEARAQRPQVNGMKHKKILDVHYFSTFFWSKLVSEGYERARLAKWTKKFDIFAKDIILIPINHNNAHWTAAAINFRRKRMESYDSMNLERRMVFKKLRDYLDLEHRNKKGTPFDFEDWIDYDPDDAPQQENGYDCGVFTCQFMESLSRGEELFNFTQRDMDYFRKRMIWEIAHAKFLDVQ